MNATVTKIDHDFQMGKWVVCKLYYTKDDGTDKDQVVWKNSPLYETVKGLTIGNSYNIIMGKQEKNPKYWEIKEILPAGTDLVGPAAINTKGKPMAYDNKDEAIRKAVALKAAVEYSGVWQVSTTDVLVVAREFEEYLTPDEKGDDDVPF